MPSHILQPLVAFGSAHKLQKQWMRTQGAGEQFRMKLGSDEEWMRRVVEDLHDAPIRSHATKEQSGLFESGFIGVIDLVAMSEALTHHVLAVEALHARSWYEQDIMAAQPLGPTQVADLLLLWEQGDEWFWRMRLKFSARGLFDTADVAGELDRRHLKPETQ